MPATAEEPRTISERLVRLRFARKWGQVEVARRLGIHQSSLSRIEAGVTQPRQKLRERIEALLLDSSASEHEQPVDRIVRRVASSPELRSLVIRILEEHVNA
jgi:transcriptional regulator with XRE-family HTH domain